MKVKVTIQRSRGQAVEHIAEVSHDGDLLKAVGAAMESYRIAHHEIPIFDHSTIKVERIGNLRGTIAKWTHGSSPEA